MSSSDYRTGPAKVFGMARGELLGPVDSGWPDAANPGKTLQYYHKVPNGLEDAKLTSTRVNRETQGFAMEFILRALDSAGERIYKVEEYDTIQTTFPPDDVFAICREFNEQSSDILTKVLKEGGLGNS